MTIFHAEKTHRSEFDNLVQYLFSVFFLFSGKPGESLSFLKYITKKILNLDSGNFKLVTNSDLVTGFGPGVTSGPCHPASYL